MPQHSEQCIRAAKEGAINSVLIDNRMSIVKYLIVAMAFFSIEVAAQQSPHGPLTHECMDCHTTNEWKTLADPMKFNHSQTGYMLVGQHRNTACKECHIDLHFSGTPKTCYACHARDYDDAIAINHRAAGFNTDCSQCHSLSAASWRANFDLTTTRSFRREVRITQFPVCSVMSIIDFEAHRFNAMPVTTMST